MGTAKKPRRCWPTIGAKIVKLLVFGQSGQVAQSLIELAGPGLEIDAKGRNKVDLFEVEKINEIIATTDADAIINAAAYTAVDLAETEHENAYALNHLAVAAMGKAAQSRNLPLVHISTDYVFNGGGKTPWQPQDSSGPLGVYGASKLAGEQALTENCECFAILRTSWVFSRHGSNFVKTMLRLGRERDHLNIVGDQVGGPTAATDIAFACVEIAQSLVANRNRSGVWHYSGKEDCSWADFAKEIFHQSEIPCDVNPILSSEFPTTATRPHNSRLDCTTTERDFGIKRPNWKLSLSKVLENLEKPNEIA